MPSPNIFFNASFCNICWYRTVAGIEQRRSTQQKLIQAKSDLLQAKYELLKRTYEREKSLLFEDSEEELHAVEQRMQFAKGLVERKENEFQALFDEVLISSPLSPHVGFQLMTESSSMSLSGLEVARRFSDYRIVRQLSPNVYHSEFVICKFFILSSTETGMTIQTS